MHYLCKVLAEKLPELLHFSNELGSLEAASKMQLKVVVKDSQMITKGLHIVTQEKKMCKVDGHLSKVFVRKIDRSPIKHCKHYLNCVPFFCFPFLRHIIDGYKLAPKVAFNAVCTLSS